MNRNNIIKKILSSLIISLIIIMSIHINVNALDTDIFTGEITDTSEVEGITNILGKVIVIISTIGSVVSIIVLIVLGIKYMIGSIDEKAEYKKSLIPYMIGAFCVFGASFIVNSLFEIVN